jgi:outer membrane protein insertion porin family
MLPMLGTAMLALAPVHAGAAQWPAVPTGRVAEILLVVDGRTSADPTLERLAEVRIGEPLQPAAVREGIVNLMALGRFDDVQVRAEASPGGLRVTFEATSTRKVIALVFRGDLGLSASELRAAVTERYTAAPPLSRAGEIARLLETLCQDHGFLRARVTERVELAPEPDRATLVFDVKAGPQVRAATLSVIGEAGSSAAYVLERCGLQQGRPFDPVAVRARAAAFGESLHALRYFEATITPSFEYADSGDTADVTVAVNRGPLVTLVFTGDPLPPSREDELVPIRREGSVDEDLLEDAQRNIENFLRSQGYSDAVAEYTRKSSDRGLQIVYNVRRGPQFRIGAVELTGNQEVPAQELRASLRSQPGALYVRSVVDADVVVLSEHYRRLGYGSVKVTPVLQREVKSDAPNQGTVRIRMEIVEGPRTLIDSVRFEGNARLQTPELENVIESAKGRPFDPATLGRDRQAVLVEYLNHGYQTASVETPTAFSEDRHTVTVTFLIREGPQVLVDDILIVGANRTKTETIERELRIRRGEPLSQMQLMETQERLLALGLFRRVSVTELPRGSETTRDVLVSVVEAPARTFSYGGGVEGSRRLLREGPGGGQTVERFQFAPRGFFDVTQRNLWGRNRTVGFFARVSIRPKDPAPESDAPDANWTGGGLAISDYRVQASYREPKIIGDRTDLAATALSEQGYRSSFDFSRQLGRIELAYRMLPRVTLGGSVTVENTRLFNERFNAEEQLLIDRVFPQVRLSFLGSTLARDTRDDALDPDSGSLMSIDAQLAARFLGSEVGFIKGFAQGFWFRQLPATQRIVFAGGVRIGLARGFRTVTPLLGADGNPVIGPDGQPVTIISTSIPASERFYAGGDTTVRAFTQDRLGVAATIDSNGFPRGGQGMVVANAELRFTILQWLGVVTFIDVGNVFARTSDIRVGDLKPAIGAGIRLRLPIIPLVRFDAGYNPYPRTFGNGSREKSYGIYFGIGQAF